MPVTATVTDPALPWLEEALDRDAAESAVLDGLRARVAIPGGARLETTRLLRHKPGRRAVIEYQVAGPGDWRLVVLGKTRAKGVDTRTLALHDAVSRLQLTSAAVPAGLGIVAQYRLWLQERVSGRGGFEALTGAGGGEVARRIGRAVANFHQCPPVDDREHEVATELAIAERALAELVARVPGLADRVESLRGGLSRCAAEIDPGPRRLIHRDFYPDQLLVGDQVYLVDLDLHAIGDPSLDLGNFIAHLIEYDFRHREGLGLVRFALDFVAGYRERGDRLSADQIAGYLTLSLARLAGLSVTIPGRRHTTEPLLAMVERRLAGVTAQ